MQPALSRDIKDLSLFFLQNIGYGTPALGEINRFLGDICKGMIQKGIIREGNVTIYVNLMRSLVDVFIRSYYVDGVEEPPVDEVAEEILRLFLKGTGK